MAGGGECSNSHDRLVQLVKSSESSPLVDRGAEQSVMVMCIKAKIANSWLTIVNLRLTVRQFTVWNFMIFYSTWRRELGKYSPFCCRWTPPPVRRTEVASSFRRCGTSLSSLCRDSMEERRRRSLVPVSVASAASLVPAESRRPVTLTRPTVHLQLSLQGRSRSTR